MPTGGGILDEKSTDRQTDSQQQNMSVCRFMGFGRWEMLRKCRFNCFLRWARLRECRFKGFGRWERLRECKRASSAGRGGENADLIASGAGRR